MSLRLRRRTSGAATTSARSRIEPGMDNHVAHAPARENEREQRMTTLRQQRTEALSGALPSDGLSRFIGAGAWAAMAGGSAMVASLLLEWLVVPPERRGTGAFLRSSFLIFSG